MTVDGLVDAHNSGQLRYILSDLIDHQGNRNLVIDLRDVTLGDGANLELFVQAANAARRKGGQVTLCPPAGSTAEELEQPKFAHQLDFDGSAGFAAVVHKT